MEMSTKLKKSNINNRLDTHDLALESCGYLKTKLFMAKRISDQQLEIDELKDSLFNLTLKYTNLLEFIKNEKSSEKSNNLIQLLEEKSIKNSKEQSKNQNSKCDKIYLDEIDDEIDLAKSGNTSIHNGEGIFNLSNDCKSIDFEKNNSPILENKAQDELEKEENKINKFIPENKALEEEHQTKEAEKKVKFLEEENLLLRRNNDILLQELNKCKLEISKISYEKFSLFSELNEILDSFSKIDLEELNKFYLESLNQNSNISSIYSAMGIKYNILSASNTLGLHAVNHSFSYYNLGNSDSLKKKGNFDSKEKNNSLGQMFSEKYLLNIREKFHKFDDELNHYVSYDPERIHRKANNDLNKISNRKNVNYNSSRISSVCFDSENRTDI